VKRLRVSLFAIIVSSLILGPFCTVYGGDDIHGLAHLTYRSTETETEGDKDTFWQFSQIYNLGVSKAFTPKVDFTADIDVNVAETDEESENTTRMSPDLRLNVTNEYFDANTGYRMTERGLDMLGVDADEDRRTSESWNANFATKSERYPRVRLRYNEDTDYDHLDVRETDTKATNFSGSTDYTYRFLNLYYEYRRNTSDDFVEDSTQDTDIHEGRVNFRQSFWENKVTSSGSYSITNSKTDTKPRGEEVSIDEPTRASQGLFADDPPNPVSVTLSSLPALIDGNRGTSAGINIGGGSSHDDQNIGLDLNLATDVQKIYLYTTTPSPDLTLPDPGFRVNDFRWAVYSSSDNATWTVITNNAAFDYDIDENRFEISFARTRARYFKVVNTENEDLINVFVTEIEANDVTTFAAFSTTETERTTETIQANLGYKPTDWLSFTYDFTQDQQETEPDSETTRRHTHNVSGRVERELHKYLTTWAQYRRRWEDDTEAEDTTTDTYLVHFLSSPLETLHTDLSLNHTVTKEESDTQSKSSSALLQITARLREGADLDIDGNITRSENLVSESDTTSKFINSNLRLELTRMLTAEIEYNRNWTDTEQPGGDTTGRTSRGELTLYWRPSRDFYLRGSYGIDRDEESGDEASRQQYNMNWLMTEKMQLDMGYTLDSNDTDTQTYSSNLSWDLSRALTLRFGYDWSRQETETITETQTFTTDLSARF
jgi:hypothetical protein